MKNTFLKTAAGLFAAILLGAFVLSCEGPAGSNGSSGTIIPQVAAYSQAEAYYAAGYDTVRLAGDEAVSGPMTPIPAGKTLILGAGYQITVESTGTAALAEKATLQLEDGASLYFDNTGATDAKTRTLVKFGAGAKIAGSEGVAALEAGENGAELLLKEYAGSLTGSGDATADQTRSADVSFWAAAGKVAMTENHLATGLLKASQSLTAGEDGEGEKSTDLNASNGLSIADGSVLIVPSGIVAESIWTSPSGVTPNPGTVSLNDIFAKATGDITEVVINNLNIDQTFTDGTYKLAAAEVKDGTTIYVPEGKKLPLIAGATDLTYTINGKIVAIGESLVSISGGTPGGVKVIGAGSIEMAKDENGVQTSRLTVVGATGGAGGSGDTTAGAAGKDVVVVVSVDGYFTSVSGGTGGTNGAFGAAGVTTGAGGAGGNVYVLGNVKGTLEGGLGGTGSNPANGGATAGAPGKGGDVYIDGEATGGTVRDVSAVIKIIESGADAGGLKNPLGLTVGSFAGGTAGNIEGAPNETGSFAAACGAPGTFAVKASKFELKNDGTFETLSDVSEGKLIAKAQGMVGGSAAGSGNSFNGGAGGNVLITGEATYIEL